MNTIKKYIIVDDDPNNNIICNIMLESVLGKVEIETFEIPEEGLSFIQKAYKKNVKPTVLFLDINMPSLTAWQFMEKFKSFSEKIKKQINIYILSSSVDQRDKDRAKADKYIKGFISKPLEISTIRSIAEG